MSHPPTIEELAKKCGDFFKKLSEYCYEYPKTISAIPSKPSKTPQPDKNPEKPKKPIKQKPNRNSKKNGDPNLPKKPLTPYITYFQEHKQRFQSLYPDLNLSDITKLIAKEWKQRTENDKKPYLEKAEHDRKRYEVELGDYEEKKKTHKTVIEISEKESDSEEEDEENSEQ